jgi:nitrogen fixation-related uncharacterized protein
MFVWRFLDYFFYNLDTRRHFSTSQKLPFLSANLIKLWYCKQEQFEDTKGVIRRRKSKEDGQYNDQKKKTNNDLQNTTQKIKDLNRNESGRFGALKSDSTHHFFRNACTKSGWSCQCLFAHVSKRPTLKYTLDIVVYLNNYRRISTNKTKGHNKLNYLIFYHMHSST